MDYKNENIEDMPDVSDEDVLLTPKKLSKEDRRNLSDYNRLIKKGFLSTLTESEYKVWRLYSNTQTSIELIAESLNLTKKEVKKYIRQVVGKLKEELETEKDWGRPIQQKFHKNGLKRGIHTVIVKTENDDSEQVDKLFKERIKSHQKEIDAWLNIHPLVRRKPED